MLLKGRKNPWFVPFLSAESITFVAANNVRKDSGGFRKFASEDATLLTLGCTDASIVPLSLNRSVAYAIKQTDTMGKTIVHEQSDNCSRATSKLLTNNPKINISTNN